MPRSYTRRVRPTASRRRGGDGNAAVKVANAANAPKAANATANAPKAANASKAANATANAPKAANATQNAVKAPNAVVNAPKAANASQNAVKASNVSVKAANASANAVKAANVSVKAANASANAVKAANASANAPKAANVSQNAVKAANASVNAPKAANASQNAVKASNAVKAANASPNAVKAPNAVPNIPKHLRRYANLRDAVIDENLSQVEEFLLKNPDLNEKDERGLSVLHYAAVVKDYLVFSALFNYMKQHKRMLTIDITDNRGRTPLLLAFLYEQPFNGRSFKELGANINLQNKHGHSPLMLAMYEDNVTNDVIRTLVQAGANPNMTDKQGMTALDHATHLLERQNLPEEYRQRLTEIVKNYSRGAYAVPLRYTGPSRRRGA